MADKQRTRGNRTVPLSLNRRGVMASASVNREKNTFPSLTEVDISEPGLLMNEHFGRTGEKLLLTAHFVACLAQALKNHPHLNSFRRGNQLVIFDDVTFNVLIEREYAGEKVPEPIGIREARKESYQQINAEIRAAQTQSGEQLGSLSGTIRVRLIPGFLLRTFFRMADRIIRPQYHRWCTCRTILKDLTEMIKNGNLNLKSWQS